MTLRWSCLKHTGSNVLQSLTHPNFEDVRTFGILLNMKKEYYIISFSVGLGIIIGTTIGAVFGNVGLWITAGIILGAIIGVTISKVYKK